MPTVKELQKLAKERKIKITPRCGRTSCARR